MLHSIILGIIEGFTEFLPISSTGHIIIYNYFSGADLSSSYVKLFTISVQLGAILAVVFYYFKDLIKKETIKLLIVGVLPTIALGLIFKNYVDKLLELPMLVAINLIIGGFVIIFVEVLYKKRKSMEGNILKKEISYKDSAIFGVVQSIAMVPGVSRSGIIIIYGLYKNFDREILAKYTFLLAVPTMIAATGYSILKSYKLFLNNTDSYNMFLNLSLGFVSAFVTAMLVVRFAIPFIRKYSFIPFGIYRIMLGFILIFIMV